MSIRFSGAGPLSATAPAYGKPAPSGLPPEESGLLENNARKEAFSHFLRYTTPTPAPKKSRFYWNELKANFRTSMSLGQARYRENLLTDRYTRLKALLVTVAFGLGYAVFRRLRRTFSMLFMLGMMAGPIKEALRTLPSLEEAYEQVRQGNPTLGRQTFQVALDDGVYSIMHDFMKPLTFGMAMGILLSVPSVLRGEGRGAMNRVLRVLGRWLHIKPTQAPLRLLDKGLQPMIEWGDRVSNRLRHALPFLKWLEGPP